MNNNIEFSTSAHNLLRKTNTGNSARQAHREFSSPGTQGIQLARHTGNSARQAHRDKSASLLASPQVARKKRFTKLDLALMTAKLSGSIGPSAARNKLTYD